MVLDDIPADRIMSLTGEMDGLFRAAHCVPTCHVCRDRILLGAEFQLVSFNGRDEMTCSKVECGRTGLEAHHKRMTEMGYLWAEDRGYTRTRGGFSRPSL